MTPPAPGIRVSHRGPKARTGGCRRHIPASQPPTSPRAPRGSVPQSPLNRVRRGRARGLRLGWSSNRLVSLSPLSPLPLSLSLLPPRGAAKRKRGNSEKGLERWGQAWRAPPQTAAPDAHRQWDAKGFLCASLEPRRAETEAKGGPFLSFASPVPVQKRPIGDDGRGRRGGGGGGSPARGCQARAPPPRPDPRCEMGWKKDTSPAPGG